MTQPSRLRPFAWALRPRPMSGRRSGRPRAALVAVATSCLLVVVTAALGPSAAVQPGLLDGGWPLHWHANPGPTTVTALLAAAIVIGGYGLTGCLRALGDGWSPDPRRLFAAAAGVVVLLTVLPPVGSADPGSYVAYGRLAATGHDPYSVPPSALTGSYAGAAEAPWRTATSVYGPLATAEQSFAARLAGSGPGAPGRAILILDIVDALAFLAAGLLLLRLAKTKPGRRRVAVLFCANPLLLVVGVAGQHLDVLTAFFAIAAVGAFGDTRGRGVLAGILGGAAAAVKASAGLVGLALAWMSWQRRRPTRLLAVALGAGLVLVPGYVWAGRRAFDQLGHASGFVSFADPWRLVTHPLEVGLGHSAARLVIRIAAWAAFAVLALLLDRGLPGRRDAGVPAMATARAAAVLSLAWLFTAPYVLPWYAVTAFGLLALLPRSGYDRLLVVWTAVLALAYLPGRQVALPGALHAALTGWKSGIAPVALLCVAVVAGLISVRTRP